MNFYIKEIDGISLYKNKIFSYIKNDCYFLIFENAFSIIEIHF